jgi:hypothetical protein
MVFFTFNPETLEIIRTNLTKEESRSNIKEELPVCQDDFDNVQVGMFLSRDKKSVYLKPYNEVRKLKYPSIEEQLDMLWHSINDHRDLKESSWFTTIEKVKTSIPKD